MGSTYSTSNGYQSSYSIDIRLNNGTQNITYTIVSSNRSADRSIVKTITTVATNRTVTYKVDPNTRQLSDNNGDLSGTDGDFDDFLGVVREISSTLAIAWEKGEVEKEEKKEEEQE